VKCFCECARRPVEVDHCNGCDLSGTDDVAAGRIQRVQREDQVKVKANRGPVPAALGVFKL
jgi:hypothetical protein